jgi:hypothetical protein
VTYPTVSETIRDGGMGFSDPAVLLPVVIGATSLGAKNVFELYSSTQEVINARGEGPGVQSICEILTNGGGPCALVAPTCSVAGSVDKTVGTYGTPGTNGAITRSGGTSGPAISAGGSPTRASQLKVEITTGGIVGTAVFRWSEDNGSTYTTSVVTAATVLLGTTGVIVTFPAGTYVLGEIYSWTASITGGAVVGSGTVNLDAHVRVEILSAGALGVATFRYCCDDYPGSTAPERNFSEPLTIPAGGVFVTPNLNLTLTFSGTFVAGDVYEIDCETAAPNATNLGAAMVPLQQTITPWRFAELVLTRANGDSTAHAVMAAAFQAQLSALQAANKYRRGMQAADQGEDTPTTTTNAFVNTVAPRLLLPYQRVRVSTVKTFPGYAAPVTHSVDVFAARATRSIPSTDLKRTLDGSLTEVLKIFHDERATPSSLDDAKISTLRTWDRRAGFYIGQAKLKSGTGSDFRLWTHGILMDLACEIAHDVGIDIIGRNFRTNRASEDGLVKAGSIIEADCSALDQIGYTRLKSVLLEQPNAEGTRGWVQDVLYRVDRLHNFLADGVVLVDVGIKPFRSADFVKTTLGFQTDLLAVAA